ncbi:hypothetical protein SASC598O02_007470, partial [Snodgrassella alvi SCGC AB-598-O02]
KKLCAWVALPESNAVLAISFLTGKKLGLAANALSK